jgi:light-regulated signal transduction histidine kinase (bacteriophytochrome)
MLNEQLRRANEDLKQFAFAASHDLQEPLRMVTTYSQLSIKGHRGELEGQTEMCIDFITKGAKHMRDLLTDLLSNADYGDQIWSFDLWPLFSEPGFAPAVKRTLCLYFIR